MGQRLFEEVREYREVEAEVDALLGYSMRRLCVEDPGGQLKQTRYTQPSLYVVNALHYYKASREGAKPSYLAGHSLGEYNALHAAGVFDFVTGLRLVVKRGELMDRVKNGGMAAVVGLPSRQVAAMLADHGQRGFDIASFNAPDQVVISGPAEEIKTAEALFLAAGARLYAPLQVSAAFHSRYMKEPAREYADFLAAHSFATPGIPVISNVTAQPYPPEGIPQTIRDGLVAQITHSVQWTQSVRYLLGQGVSEFRELGPGTVLTRLIKQIRETSSADPAKPAAFAQA